MLLREWAVYRYGVFKEHGFPRDPVYPLYLPKPGSQDPNEIELNVCANGPVKPQFRFVSFLVYIQSNVAPTSCSFLTKQYKLLLCARNCSLDNSQVIAKVNGQKKALHCVKRFTPRLLCHYNSCIN